MRTPFLIALLVAVAVPAFGQEDVEGAKDHPMFTRLAGYYISDFDEQEFGVHEFEFDEKAERVEGHYWHITYSLREGGKKAGPLQIVRNYANAIVGKGGERLFEESASNYALTVARLATGGRNLWVSVRVGDSGEYYELTVVDGGAMEQQVEFDAGELAAALREKGSVALRGVQFDTGKATIKAESAPLLAVVGELLTTDPALRLEIEGHTDNVGARAANQKLSHDRAASVREYLVKTHEVAPDRLTAVGYGDSRPVADNDTEEGRAKNRRVELVRK
ncbi:MAG TPA: OmpA family protein [Vicinamibacterales bacterium]|nr:OmpA family protein [Vicinamibacterales bacterium]